MTIPHTLPVRSSSRERCIAMWRLARVDRGIAAGVHAMVGMYLADSDGRLSVGSGAIAVLVVALVTWYGNAINDVADATLDARSKPERAIPSGAISLSLAVAYSGTLAMIALALAATLGPLALLIACGAFALATAYSFGLKSTLLVGNLAVGACVGGTLVFGGIVAGGVSPSIVVGAIMSGLYLTAQEVLFNIEDEDGDRLGGLATTATRLGRVNAIRLHRALVCCFVVAATYPMWLGNTAAAYAPALLLCIGAPLAIILVLLLHPDDARIHRAVRLSRVAWVVGAVPLLLLRS